MKHSQALKFISAFGALFYWVIAVHAAGTVPGFSLTPQFDLSGKVMPGCRLNVIQAGTVSTPQVAYQDSALTIPSPGGANLSCDASGRLPQFFLADGLIKIRLSNSLGVQVFVGDNLLVVGPSSGGGGGGTVDPTTILSTGDFKLNYGTGILTGFVRANGRTIGSATSGATERANLDCQALFQYLWGADATLAVSGGRGVSAAADWAANKTIALPDWRGRALAGLDDMGNAAAGRLTATYWGASGPCSGALGTVLGQACGGESKTLLLANLPPYTPLGSIVTTINTTGGAVANVAGPIQYGGTGSGGNAFTITATSAFTGTAQGGTSAPFPIMPPMGLLTVYVKL